MTRHLLLCLAAVLLIALAGCGGGGDSRTLTLRTSAYGQAASASWVAFQDGDGPWHTLSPTRTGVYSATVTDAGGRYGLAVVTHGGPINPSINLYHATLAELPAIDCRIYTDILPARPATIAGTVSGIPEGADWLADLTTRDNSAYAYQYSPAYSLDVQAGQHDLIAKLIDSSVDQNMPQKIAIVRNITARAGSTTTADIDFTDVPSTVPATITVANGSIDWANVLVTTSRRVSALLAYPSGDDLTSFPCVFPAESQHVAGDVYSLDLNHQDDQGGLGTLVTFDTGGDRTVTLPDPFGDATVDMVTTGYAHPVASWEAYPGADYYLLQCSQDAAGGARYWACLATAGWLQGATTYAMPDLSGVDGWPGVLTFTGDPLLGSAVEADVVTNAGLGQALRAPYSVWGALPVGATCSYAYAFIPGSVGVLKESVRKSFDRRYWR